MSIVNISSENMQPGGQDNDFEIVLKKPLQKLIGMQVLNVTIPLTYNIVEGHQSTEKNAGATDDVFVYYEGPDYFEGQTGAQYEYLTDVQRTQNENDGSGGGSASDAFGTYPLTGPVKRRAILNRGTYTADELARELERAMNKESAKIYPKFRNQNQRALHLENQILSIPISRNNLDFRDKYNQTLIKIRWDRIEPGMMIYRQNVVRTRDSLGGDPLQWAPSLVSRAHIIKDYTPETGVGHYTKSWNGVDNIVFPSSAGSVLEFKFGDKMPETIGSTTTMVWEDWALVWPGYICWYDPHHNKLRIASDKVIDPVRTMFPVSADSTIIPESSYGGYNFYTKINENSRRMSKTLGIDRTVRYDSFRINVMGGSNELIKFHSASHDRSRVGRYMWSTFIPEVSGPSLLFLRVGGDAILDQQNTETHMNDRIPIPIDQPPGGIVHYENDSESDVIPFAVPCDVRRLCFRLEHGDNNEIVGGSHALNGHRLYLRLKFFKMHQQGGKKM